MIAHDFRYEAPDSLEEALELLGSFGSDAAVLGGGTWLVPNMTYGRDKPWLIIDPKANALRAITRHEDELVIGARVSYAQVLNSEEVTADAPLLAKMARQVTGGPQIVGQGTLGGSACYGNPSSDVPACLLALDAKMILRSKDATRSVAAADFFLAPFTTAKREDELLEEIRIPTVRSRVACAYEKLKFSIGSWPIVTASCLVFSSRGSGLKLRIAVGGANATPVGYEAVTALNPSSDDLSAIAQRASELVDNEWTDAFAGSGYRRTVTPAIVGRVLRRALDREAS
ncbi:MULTISPECIES: FAD binding domain-containing protein [unclassified Bradyrhizobium]|uniref:FAD binding domain-containing protein n=1 Tax=unclassified Bradyrhizobium TaxID=2631580 RepID=UPI002306843C|nr:MULTISPECIES: FAD binding domain-containing protein [unclassified Bradyrhizobium]MDA9451226.1 hypothetical protein [Bradyrhizobium sp. CCBAU 21360]MDA9457605.1 hypothetical protein [Bradyrhizobium sp. CCBAU 21359]